jgi:hypothetical protein
MLDPWLYDFCMEIIIGNRISVQELYKHFSISFWNQILMYVYGDKHRQSCLRTKVDFNMFLSYKIVWLLVPGSLYPGTPLQWLNLL